MRGRAALSNHAPGRAVDINRGNNSYITSIHDKRAIFAVTGVDLGQSQNYQTMRTASTTFQQTFNQTWVNQQTAERNTLQAMAHRTPEQERRLQSLRRILNSVQVRRAALNGYAATGFLNLREEAVNALTGAGFSWGGNWNTIKDFMHFEM